ncbi:hypothetical protein OIV83_003859 [Microbotryomycetes sp. JL201]|nr:hypothetical protein OIV83_003859 [Microbotryomycetes sp. JL201]
MEPTYHQKSEAYDAEKNSVDVVTRLPADQELAGEQPLQRQLKVRHIQMISIGGVIGTGLFLGTANGLRKGGPLGLFLGFSAIGSVTYCVMVALGEMVAHLPVPGGHITLAQRFVNPSLSFTMGWNYWYNWTIVLPAELNAAAVLIGYWSKNINPAVWITITLVVAVAINFGGTRFYGEAEFWFAIIKIVTIVGLIILGIILDAGGGPDHDPIGFRYWRNPGPFVQRLGIAGATGRFLGFFAVLTQAAFSYIGTEIVAIAAGEAKNPRKSLPRAIKGVYIRIIVFYLLGTFVIGLLVPSNDPRLKLGSGTAASSPFVIAINNAGIKALPSIINAALLSSAWSAASSDLYTSSRALYGLALNGNAPKFLRKVNSWGLPWVCVLIGTAFSFLSYMSAGSTNAGTVFNWFANMTSACGLLTWMGILYTYLRFHKATKAQGVDRRTLAFTAPLQPYLSWYAFIFIGVILFFQGWEAFYQYGSPGYVFPKSDFVTQYFPVWFAPVLYFAHAIYTRGWRQVKPAEADLVSGSRGADIDDVDDEEDKPKNFVQKVWAFLTT